MRKERIQEACKIITRDIREKANGHIDNLSELLNDPYFRGRELEKLMNEKGWYETIATEFNLYEDITINETAKGIKILFTPYAYYRDFIIENFGFQLDSFKKLTGYKLNY